MSIIGRVMDLLQSAYEIRRVNSSMKKIFFERLECLKDDISRDTTVTEEEFKEEYLRRVAKLSDEVVAESKEKLVAIQERLRVKYGD